MTKQFKLKISERDLELLTSLDRCPLTPHQLFRISQAFANPFTDEHNLRRRLRELAQSAILRSFPYAMSRDGRTPNYWKLTQEGYRLLYGIDAALPKRRYFEAVRAGHHHHTYCLAELIVHLCVTARQNGAELLHFARENSVKIEVPPFVMYPDCAFVIRRKDGKSFPFVVELDNGTERVRSKQDVESIERKLRGYDAHQASFDAHDPNRYLVVFVTTRSETRLKNILTAAANVMLQPQRRVFVGAELSTFLSADPFAVSLLEDHRGLKRQLIPIV